MLVIDFGSEVIEAHGVKYVPILDTYTGIDALIHTLQDIKSKYDVKQIFLAGDSVVGSVCDIGDYVCLVAELR